MLTEEQLTPLMAECGQWKEQLSTYRDKINHLKNVLHHFALLKTDEQAQVNKEHFENQFYIQLINIHDLQHDIKRHLEASSQGAASAGCFTQEELREKVAFLTHHLDQLQHDFHAFLKS